MMIGLFFMFAMLDVVLFIFPIYLHLGLKQESTMIKRTYMANIFIFLALLCFFTMVDMPLEGFFYLGIGLALIFGFLVKIREYFVMTRNMEIGLYFGFIVSLGIAGIMTFFLLTLHPPMFFTIYTIELSDFTILGWNFVAMVFLACALLSKVMKGYGYRSVMITFSILATLAFVGFATTAFSGILFPGQLDFSGPSNMFFLVVRSPLIQIGAAAMAMASLLKVIDNPSAEALGNFILVIIPLIFWITTFIGVTPVPEEVMNFFVGFEFFGWFFFIMMMGLIFITISAMISLFSRIPKARLGGLG